MCHRIHWPKLFLLSFALLLSLDIDWHRIQFCSSSNTKHIYYRDFFSNPKSTNLAIKRQLRTARNSYTPFKFHAAVFSHTDEQVSVSRRFMLLFSMFSWEKKIIILKVKSSCVVSPFPYLKNTLTFILLFFLSWNDQNSYLQSHTKWRLISEIRNDSGEQTYGFV